MRRLRIALVARPITAFPENGTVPEGYFAGCLAIFPGSAIEIQSEEGILWVEESLAMESSIRFRDFLLGNPAALAIRALELVCG